MRLFKTKVFLVFLVFILISLIYLSYSNPNFYGVGGNLVNTVMLPFQKGLTYVDRIFDKKLNYFEDVELLKVDNENLSKKIDELQKEKMELLEYKQKITELKEALNLKERVSDFDFSGANIIAKDSGNWFEVFTIDLGTKDGIKLNSPVVTGKGLVGRVSSYDIMTSKVTTIIDPDSAVSARISKTRDLVLIKGDISLKNIGLCRMDNIPNDVDIVEGDLVETSGIGGIFPKGIVIGKIGSIIQSENEFTKKAEIVPAVDFKRLEEVYILNYKNK